MKETSFNKSKKDFIKFIEIARTDIKNDAHAKLSTAPEKSKEAAPPVPMEEDGPLRTVNDKNGYRMCL